MQRLLPGLAFAVVSGRCPPQLPQVGGRVSADILVNVVFVFGLVFIEVLVLVVVGLVFSVSFCVLVVRVALVVLAGLVTLNVLVVLVFFMSVPV
jgi:hypothetical protein